MSREGRCRGKALLLVEAKETPPPPPQSSLSESTCDGRQGEVVTAASRSLAHGSGPMEWKGLCKCVPSE